MRSPPTVSLLLSAWPVLAPKPPPPPYGANCNPPKVNSLCFTEEGQPSAEVCCGSQPPDACWTGFQTARSCCAGAALAAPPECDDGDLKFLTDLAVYFQTGSLPPRLLGFRGVGAVHTAEVWEDEFVRCPAAALAELAARAELLAAAAGGASDAEEADEAYRDSLWALSLVHFFQSAAMIRGSMPRSPHRYPASVVYEARNRAQAAQEMYQDTPSYLRRLLDRADVDANARSPSASCIPDMQQFERCMIFKKEPGIWYHVLLTLRLLRAEPHAQSVTSRAPLEGQIAVLLARLFGVAALRGIRDSASRALLQAAAASVRPLHQNARRGSFRLGTRARLTSALAFATKAVDSTNLTEPHYSETDVGKERTIMDLLHRVGTKSKFFVEIGVGDGSVCNTRFLRQHHGWRGVMFDQISSNLDIGLHRRFLTAANINSVLDDLGVPEEFDLLSLDVDGNDFWLWRELRDSYRPRVVIIEYEKAFGREDALARYAPSGLSFATPNTQHLPLMGASAVALVALGRAKGYRLAAYFRDYDLVFAREDLLPGTAELAMPQFPAVPAVAALLRSGEFHIASAEALAIPPVPLADVSIHPAWAAECLEERFVQWCRDEHVGKLCWPS